MKKIYTLLLFLFAIHLASAQPDEGYEDDPYADYATEQPEGDAYDWSWKARSIPTSPPPPPTPVPIDGGAGLLLLAGIGYGIRKMRKR